MIGYKGFDKNFRCRGMQYEVGKTYHHDGELKICESGLHFCANPLDIFPYYPPADSRYALVDATGNVVKGDDKSCTDELTVIKELTLMELIAATPDENISSNTGYRSAATNTGYFSAATNTGDFSAATNTDYRSVATNTGDRSAATNTGNFSAATNTGYRSAATNTGYRSAATNTGYRSAATNTGNRSVATSTGNCSAAMVTGENSVAMVIGEDSRAKAALGCWLVLSECRNNQLADVQVFRVDGEHIKPDTFYTLKDGVPVEADD